MAKEGITPQLGLPVRNDFASSSCVSGGPTQDNPLPGRRIRRTPATKPQNQALFDQFKFTPVIDAAYQIDWQSWPQSRKDQKTRQKELAESVWGQAAIEKVHMSPSIAAHCLKWAGYDMLGQHKPDIPKLTSMITMDIGSGAHYRMLQKLQRYVPGGIQELRVYDDETNMSGRIDFLFRNPATGRYQIVDLKFIHSFPFKKMNRDHLPEHMRNTKGIVTPDEGYAKQVMLYMSAKRKEGIDVACANLVSINRDSGEIKESLILWDELTEYEVQEFTQQIKKANSDVEQGKLPQPTVDAPHVCANYCPYRKYCDYGQQFAAGAIKREPKKRRPLWVKKQLQQGMEAQRLKMIDMGVAQGALPGLEQLVFERQNRKEEKQSIKKEATGPTCGECGAPTRWDNKAAKGGKFVCPTHG